MERVAKALKNQFRQCIKPFYKATQIQRAFQRFQFQNSQTKQKSHDLAVPGGFTAQGLLATGLDH